MEKIKKWYINLTDMQVLGLAFLNLFVYAPFIIIFFAFLFGANGAFIGLTLYISSLIYFFYLDRIRKTHILSTVKRNYELAKDKLRQQPSNNQLREKALQTGREYYKSLRNGILSIYDEQAITNDLAALSPISQTNNVVQLNTDKAVDNNQTDIVSKLEKLKELKDKGIINESEFESKKKDLIDRM